MSLTQEDLDQAIEELYFAGAQQFDSSEFQPSMTFDEQERPRFILLHLGQPFEWPEPWLLAQKQYQVQLEEENVLS